MEQTRDPMPSAPGDQGPLSAEFDARLEPGLLLSAIVDSTADMIWSIDAQGFRLLSTNRSLREYLGGRGFDVRPGMTPEECVPAPEAETWRAYYRRALREGPYSIEHVTAVGDRFLELHFNLIEREGRAIAISVFGRDITERRGAADRLRGSEAFFRALQEESPDLAVVIAANGRYTFVSSACAKMLGYTAEEVMALPPLDLVHPDDRARLARTMVRVKARIGGVDRQRYRVRHRDGSWRFLDSVARNDLENPQVAGIVVNSRDVTEEVLLAARLEQVREEEKGRIARDLHDQLGQMLTGLKLDVLWLEEQLEAMAPTPAVNALVERAVEASALADQTVTEVQRIATALRPAALDGLGLGAALRQEGRRFESRAGVTCRVEVGEAVPELTPSTATALYRIAQEALTNVARHAQASQVIVELEAAPGEVTLAVEDDGIGLDLARTGSERALGLASMRERAALAGGELVLVARPGGGTRVMARLPLRGGVEGGA